MKFLGEPIEFRWADYTRLLDGWLPKCAVLVPFVGYAILFNDTIARELNFDHLAGSSGWKLSSQARLRLLYYGLIFLGIANILYWLRRPSVLRTATDRIAFVERVLPNCTFDDLMVISTTVFYGLPEAKSRAWLDEWREFALSVQTGIGNGEAVSWDEAKQKHGSLLRSMLRRFFTEEIKRRPLSLAVCLVLAVAGYFLLAVPSAEIFLRVTLASFAGS